MPLIADLDIPRVEIVDLHLDGEAREPAWGEALEISGFVNYRPQPGGMPVGDTVVRIMADERALYVHMAAQDPEPEAIRYTHGRRDTRLADDFFAIILDPSGEAQRAYEFRVTPLGLQLDGYMVAGGGTDMAWDAVWSSAARITDEGWEAELAIPWRAIRHPLEPEVMGLTFARRVPRNAELSTWPVRDPTIQGVLVQEALVGGPGPLPPSSGLDVVPALTFAWTDSGPPEGQWGLYGLSPGVTVQYAPWPSATMLATLNPDFSQVESDASQVDVNQRYALYYPEQRPFFIEGQEWFEHPFGEIVYTRTMVAPRYGVRATAERGPWSGGVLQVWDAEPSTSVSEACRWSLEDYPDSDWTEEDYAARCWDDGVVGDHTALETVARGRRGVQEDGYVGVLVSDRHLVGAEHSNQVVGADARLRVNDQVVFSGSALGSRTDYGAGLVELAPAGSLELEAEDGSFDGYLALELVAPGFRAENGYVTSADKLELATGASWMLYPDNAMLPRVLVSPLDGWVSFHTDGRVREIGWDGAFFPYFRRGTFAGVLGSFGVERYKDTLLPWQNGMVMAGGPFTSWLRGRVLVSGGSGAIYDSADPRTGWVLSAMADLWFQPVSRVSVELGATALTLRERDFTTVYEGWVTHVLLEVFATRSLSGRCVLDWSDFSETFGSQLLLAWEGSPGQAVYLGGSLETTAWEAPSWQVFSKVSWRFSR